MTTEIKIAKHHVDAYCEKNYATIDVKLVAYIKVCGCVVKNEPEEPGVEYETIYANSGGVFSEEWVQSELKLLFILKESYILKDSYYKDGHRGGFEMNKLYYEDDELWSNATYRNIVKITYYTYLRSKGRDLNVEWCGNENIKREACDIFRRHAAVISVNPFPGLAFKKTTTNAKLLKNWISFPQVAALLLTQIQELAPKAIFAAFDLGCISSYSHLFGWLKGRALDELVELEGEQSILGNRVISGGAVDAVAYAVDCGDTKWIQGVHPSVGLSHNKMQLFSNVIYPTE